MKNSRIGLLFCAGAVVAIVAGIFCANPKTENRKPKTDFDSPYGNFLAGQYAAAVGDFEVAAKLLSEMQSSEIKMVRESAVSAAFLAGRGDINFAALAGDDHPASKIIYLVHLAKNEKWADARKLFESDKSVIFSPLRIWPAVAENRITETIKFVNESYGSDAWKSFVRGQIYAARAAAGRDPKSVTRAAAEFADVPTDFMNLADFEYIMNFYLANDMDDAAADLHKKYTSGPGSAYLSSRDWRLGIGDSGGDKHESPISNLESRPGGYAENMAFALMQIVAHRPEANGTITGLMLLRAAQLLTQLPPTDAETGVDAPQGGRNSMGDALNYYLGNYFYESGDYKNADLYWDRLEQGSAFYPFILLKRADMAPTLHARTRARERVIREYPAFISAVIKNYAENIDAGDDAAALRGIDIALDAEIPASVRNYLNALKRAQAMAGVDQNSENPNLQSPTSDYEFDTCPTIETLGGQ
jgi:hypothetical protein